jgi:HK97 gp10 family phage protein
MPKNMKMKGNFDEVAWALKKKPKRVAFGMAIAIKKSAFLVERFAKKFTPVDTGRLRSSISADIYPTVATIQPHTNYAVFVHEGTRYMSGRPFMKMGKRSAMVGIARIFSNELRKAIR